MADLFATGIGGGLSALLYVVLFLDVLMIFAVVFLERKNPSATLMWLFVLLIFPVIGITLYLLLSQNISRQRVYKLSREEIKVMTNSLDKQMEAMRAGAFTFARPEARRWNDLIKLNQVYGTSYFTQDNKIDIMTDGGHMFGELLRDIENAKRSVCVEFFILKNDPEGKKLIEVLARKAEQGLDVKLLLDAVGSRGIWESTLKKYKEAGGKYAFFFKNKLRVINLRLNYRNHRKITVIDGQIGYIGGMNVGREYLGKKKKFGYWRDTHLRIIGGAVNDLKARFLLDWRAADGDVGTEDVREALYAIPKRGGEVGIQIVSCGPDSLREEVKRGFMKIITASTQNVYIQTPYFVPDAAILESLKMAAQSGVDVRLMIPCKPDHPFVYWATYWYAGELLKSGGRVFIYENGFIHAKTIVADGEVASVGSTNFDIRSFRLNFETNAFIYDGEVAGKLEAIYKNDISYCRELTYSEYKRRPLRVKFKESMSRLISDIL